MGILWQSGLYIIIILARRRFKRPKWPQAQVPAAASKLKSLLPAPGSSSEGEE